MKNYEAEKLKTIIKAKEESLLVHISEMDKLRARNNYLNKRVYKLIGKQKALKQRIEELELTITHPATNN